MKTLAVDVDLVLAQTDVKWWEWLSRVCEYRYIPPKPYDTLNYNLSKYFSASLEILNIDPMDFWRNEGVYDWVDPVVGSVEALEAIKEVIDCDIIAVSHCKGNHFKSKWQFLKRNFGKTIDGFIATKEKHFVACDMLIDDRNSYLNKMPEGVGCIRLDTCYTQDQEPERLMKVCKDWGEIVEYLTRHY